MADEEWIAAPLATQSDLYHIYSRGEHRSLCGKYGRSSLNDPQDVKEGDTYKKGRDCKKCCRKSELAEVEP